MTIKAVKTVIAAALFITLAALNMGLVKTAEAYYGGTSLCFEGTPLCRENIAAEENFTLWNAEENISLYGTLKYDGANAALYTVDGDMTRAVPCERLTGSALMPNDTDGCVIDAATAYELYGSENCVGQTVKLADGRTFIIRGVVESNLPLAVIISEKENAFFSNAEVSGGEDDVMSVKNAAYGQTPFVCSADEQTELLRFFMQLPLLGIALAAMILTVKMCRKNSFAPRKTIALSCSAAVLAAVSLAFLGFKIMLPQCLIPDMWSDFEFFTEKAASAAEYIKNCVQRENACRMTSYILLTLKSAALDVLCATAAVWFVRSARSFCN